MMNDVKSYLIKNQRGKIYGPYTYDKILEFIENGMITGDEEIADYPDVKWQPISKDINLNQKLLEQLEAQSHNKSQKQIEEEFEKASEEKEVLQDDPKEPVQIEERSVYPIIQADSDWQDDEATNHTQSTAFSTQTIEVKQKKINQKRLGRFLIAVALLAIVFLTLSEKKSAKGEDLLLMPTINKNQINRNIDARKLIASALNFYKYGEKKNYIEARDRLISVIEADYTNVDATALLCLVYKELWLYSSQSSVDKKTVNDLNSLSTVKETFSASASTCNAVLHYIDGNWTKFDTTVSRVLSENTNNPIFYYLKAESLFKNNKIRNAIGYYQQAYKIWPAWIEPKLKEAQARISIGQQSIALQILQQILNFSKSNETSAIYMAYIYLFQYGNSKHAKHYIGNFKSHNSGAAPSWQAKGFEVLAKLYEASDRSTAVDYAKKALSLSADATYARSLLNANGDNEGVGLKSTAAAYIASGDLLFSRGQYFEAQAEYKTAYDLSQDSTAAAKAAKSLWHIDQQKEAIAWLNKALLADPKNFEAQIQLAHYYAERYDFMSAINQLVKAKRLGPKDYRLYQTVARIEFLRLNYDGAIKNAEQAIKLYDADIDSLIIMAKSYLKKKNYREAHYASSKAVELEVNSPELQGLYGLTLSKFQSASAGINYIKNLINTYPSNLEYRIALAEILYDDDQFTSAISVLKQIEGVIKDKYQLYWLLSKSYTGNGDYSNAMKSLLSAAQARPSAAKVYVAIGDMQMQAKKYALAIQQFLVAKQLNENYPRLNTMLGTAYLKKGDTKKAMDLAQAEIRRNPKLVDGYLLAGEAYIASGQYSKAAGQFQRVIQLQPNSSDLYVKIARAHRLAGNYDIARSMLSIAGEKESGNAEIYKESGALLEANGNSSEAIISYKRYLKLRPNAPDREEIKRIIQNLGG